MWLNKGHDTFFSPKRIRVDHPKATKYLTSVLHRNLTPLIKASKEVVVVCIGTDRSTGDALGPLTGWYLNSMKRHPKMVVYGNLEDPVHASNLNEIVSKINEHHSHSLIIAVDACLGKSSSVGDISFKIGSLLPGKGVNKNLPPIGQAHIIGVVNVGGFMEYLVLQNTRLSIVMSMAKVIALSISSWHLQADSRLNTKAVNQL